MEFWAHSIGFACLGTAVLGSAYALLAAVLLRRLRPSASHECPVAPQPGVTILKPLHGAEAVLRENLATFFDQSYAGPIQLLFVVKDESDAAVPIVRALLRERRGTDAALVVAPGPQGSNPKVAALVALEPHIRHGIVVLADSDIAVGRDHLARVTAALAAPGVGLVTCLYRGVSAGGLWARLATMGIDYHFLPGVVVGVALGLARPSFGSTIALSRQTLAAMGGFKAFVDHLADDHAMGQAVRSMGLRVAIPPLVVEHTCTERRLAELLRHELRWARTIRAVSPAGYAASVIAHPFPLALIGCALLLFRPAAVAVVVLTLAARLVLAIRVDHTLGSNSGRWRLGPARDLLSFLIFVASFFVVIVTWRGRRYRVRRDGTLAAIGDSKP